MKMQSSPGKMSNERITLKDVAAKVGVHSSTVSRVLNPATRGMVSPEIATAVAAAAKELGYRPNLFAYSLRTSRSFTIGVIIPDLTNPVFPPLIRGIEEVLGQSNYTVILANTDNDPAREETLIAAMRGRQVDGLILATARRDDKLVRDIIDDKLALVLINRATQVENIDCILTDDAAGIRVAVDHLAALGHRRIAHIAGPERLSTGHRRIAGFRHAMAAHGLDCPPANIAACDAFSEAEGQRALIALMDQPSPPTAIVAGNDMQALGCYAASEALNLNCPADISIVGFNDMPIVDRLAPPLTTVSVPLRKMGAAAAQAMLGRLSGENPKTGTMELTPHLVVRGSTGQVPPTS